MHVAPQRSYAGSNPDEFFAELTMWYFGTHGDLHMTGPKPENGRDGLRNYDPEAFRLMDDFYSGRIAIGKAEPRRSARECSCQWARSRFPFPEQQAKVNARDSFFSVALATMTPLRAAASWQSAVSFQNDLRRSTETPLRIRVSPGRCG